MDTDRYLIKIFKNNIIAEGENDGRKRTSLRNPSLDKNLSGGRGRENRGAFNIVEKVSL